MRRATRKSDDKLVSDVKKIRQRVLQAADEVSSLVAKVKNSYDELDPKTKKKVTAGLAGLGALLAVGALHHKHRKSKKRKQEQAKGE